MIAPAPPPPLTLSDFLATYGEDDRYELLNGSLIDLEPTDQHEATLAFLDQQLDREIDRQPLSLLRTYGCLITPPTPHTALRPDLMILDRAELDREPLIWSNDPIVSRATTIKLIAEVVSTCWQNDYVTKIEEYAKFGVVEYWIVDPIGLGSEQIMGVVNQPIVVVCTLNGDRYQQQVLTGEDGIRSVLFPELQLTAAQVLKNHES
jgi:Uma2 family endonuclease